VKVFSNSTFSVADQLGITHRILQREELIFGTIIDKVQD